MLTLGHLKSKREAIVACAKRHGAFSIRIFGSISRGEAKQGSDVDFLVHYAPGQSLVDHVALIDELGSLLGVPVDVVSEAALSPLLREQVLREAVPL